MEKKKKKTSEKNPKTNTSISSEERESAATALQQAKALGPEIGIDVEGILSTPQRVAALEEQMRIIANKMEEIFAYFTTQVKPTIQGLQGKSTSKVGGQVTGSPLPPQAPFYGGNPRGGTGLSGAITQLVNKLATDPDALKELIKSFGGQATDELTIELAKEFKKGLMDKAKQQAREFFSNVGKEEFIKKVAETDSAGKS